jgi:phage baseplate assembly protein gpV
MATKNILADTDFTRGTDNRFKNAVLMGKVTEIVVDKKGANIRALMPDKVDHKDQPLITKPIPVLQVCAGGKKSFAMPRVKQNVMLVKLPHGTSDYAAIGFFYTSEDPPPVTDPKLDYCEWEGGHKQTHDANDDAEVFLTQDFKGGWKATVKKNIDISTTDGGTCSIVSDGDMLVKSATGDVNVESPTGKVTINQQNIDLVASGTISIQAAEIKLTGVVTVVGAMNQNGIHRDTRGLHQLGTVEYETRIAELESRVARLERELISKSI